MSALASAEALVAAARAAGIGGETWPGPGPRLVVYDYGIKWNILRLLTDQGFASGALAVQAAQGEEAGDFVLYFNTTVNTGSLLVVSAPDTATSIARFTDATTLEDFQAIGFAANDFVFV